MKTAAERKAWIAKLIADGLLCTVPDCEMRTVAKGLCNKHYGRARRKRPLELDPERGLTAKVLVRCAPDLKRWLVKTAKRDKVSVSYRAATLLRAEMDSLAGKTF